MYVLARQSWTKISNIYRFLHFLSKNYFQNILTFLEMNIVPYNLKCVFYNKEKKTCQLFTWLAWSSFHKISRDGIDFYRSIMQPLLHFDTSSGIRPRYIEVISNFCSLLFYCTPKLWICSLIKNESFFLFLKPHLKHCKQVFLQKLKTLLFIYCIFRKLFAFLSNYSWNISYY